MKSNSAAVNFFIHCAHWVQKRADYILVILAILYSLPSLGYPFGRDQAAHFYIGREWLNGLLPFKDTFDQKPPGIYFIHALGIAMLGAHQWAIRVLDLVGILGVGLLAAKTVRRDWKPAQGEAGILVLLTAGFYYTCFDYWDTAQVETWEGLALLAGYALVERNPRSWRAFLSGALAGVAFLFKFPAALIAVVIAMGMVLRILEIDADRWFRSMIGSLALYSAGVLTVIGGCVAYFAAQGGFKDMVDVLYGFNLYYATQKPTSSNVAQQWVFDFWMKHSCHMGMDCPHILACRNSICHCAQILCGCAGRLHGTPVISERCCLSVAAAKILLLSLGHNPSVHHALRWIRPCRLHAVCSATDCSACHCDHDLWLCLLTAMVLE